MASSSPILKPITSARQIHIDDADAAPPDDLPRGEDLDKAGKHQRKRLAKLQNALYADGSHAVLVVLQGRDASGKDGTVRKVFRSVNPMGCEVTSFKVPTDAELDQIRGCLERAGVLSTASA